MECEWRPLWSIDCCFIRPIFRKVVLKFLGFAYFDRNARSYYYNLLDVVIIESHKPIDGQLEIYVRKYISSDIYMPFHFRIDPNVRGKTSEKYPTKFS